MNEDKLNETQKNFINSVLENGYDILWIDENEFVATDSNSHYLYNIETWETSQVSEEMINKINQSLNKNML